MTVARGNESRIAFENFGEVVVLSDPFDSCVSVGQLVSRWLDCLSWSQARCLTWRWNKRNHLNTHTCYVSRWYFKLDSLLWNFFFFFQQHVQITYKSLEQWWASGRKWSDKHYHHYTHMLKCVKKKKNNRVSRTRSTSSLNYLNEALTYRHLCDMS